MGNFASDESVDRRDGCRTPRFSRSRKWRGSAPTRRSVAWIWRKQRFARFRRQQLELAVAGQRLSLIPSGISGGGTLKRLCPFPKQKKKINPISNRPINPTQLVHPGHRSLRRKQ